MKHHAFVVLVIHPMCHLNMVICDLNKINAGHTLSICIPCFGNPSYLPFDNGDLRFEERMLPDSLYQLSMQILILSVVLNLVLFPPLILFIGSN